MANRTVYVESEVNISQFDTQDLLDELQDRGELHLDHDIVLAIWAKRRVGNNYETELDELIYSTLGKIV
jgi:hypothetical protein|tara:strand:- start:442 stop:648 length:207 start_codon:yes stop_codon:yes gene_type:complete